MLTSDAPSVPPCADADVNVARLGAHLASLATLSDRANEVAIAVAFSGGVDSSVVAEVAHRTFGDRALIVTLDHPLASARSTAAAVAHAATRGYRHEVIAVDTLLEPEVASNAPTRCYHCKRLLMSALRGRVADGLTVVDGTNADDAREPRPGLVALRELMVVSPLADLGISKAEVRAMGACLGLPNASQPSAPCAATRFPFGERLRTDEFGAIEWAEHRLRDAAFHDVRVRMGARGVAALQVAPEQVEEALDVVDDIESVIQDSGLELEDGFTVGPYRRNDAPYLRLRRP